MFRGMKPIRSEGRIVCNNLWLCLWIFLVTSLRFPDIPEVSGGFRGFHGWHSEKVSRKMDISFDIFKFLKFSEVFLGF